MTVHFIGAGPGAADLITLRGRDPEDVPSDAAGARAECSRVLGELTDKMRKQVRNFVEEFYEIIENPKHVARKIESKCI